MRYRLKLREPVGDGVRRTGVAQIDRAASALERDDVEAGIHEARKCFKRIRALLDMSRPALSAEVYKRENRRFRDLGRALAGPRDIHVMRHTLERLQQQHDLGEAGSVPSALRAWLGAWRSQTDPAHVATQLDMTRDALTRARERFADLPVRANNIAPLIAGFRGTYANGRNAMKQAYRKGICDETFHEWRKHVQRHWRQLQLMRNAWPEVIAPRINLASELSDIIGLDHDLAVLIAFISKNREILGARDEVSALIAAAEAEQVALRTAARPRGERLYSLPPKAIMQMLGAYWTTAPRIAETNAEATPLVGSQKVVNIAG